MRNIFKRNGSMYTRRDFLKVAGVTAVTIGAGPILSACQAEEATPEIGGAIQYLSWEGYDLRGCMEQWEEPRGVVIESTYIGDHPEIPAKLATAPGGLYDLITYYHGYYELYRDDLEIVTALERDKLPNFEDLYPFFREGRWWVDEDGTIWSVPFTFGVLGGNYMADLIDPPTSWFDLLEPEFEDKFAIIDDGYAGIIIGGRMLGLGDKLPLITREELDQIIDMWLEFKEKARTIAIYGDEADLFVSGEIIATIPGWAAVNVWSQERGANVQMYIPKEGANTFIDAFAIPPDSDNRETVLAWINESIGPEVQACQASALAAGVVNPNAVPLTDPDIAAIYDYDNLDNIFEIAPVYDLPPLEPDGEHTTYDEWITAWEEFKAA
ncbi:MAG: extracellular solute-binding protein [Anaerolineales bacterium]|nr:extracellular solute-binding protein [Anaerolineales bacterium]